MVMRSWMIEDPMSLAVYWRVQRYCRLNHWSDDVHMDITPTVLTEIASLLYGRMARDQYSFTKQSSAVYGKDERSEGI